MTWRARTLTLAGVLCAATVLTADQPAAQDSVQPAPQEPVPVFRSESDLVVLHVNVFDGRSDAVPNLPQSAFRILEDGKPQTITFFSNEDVPVAVGLIIDNSSSMITRRAMVLTGTRAFAESSHDEDELFTIVFNENVSFGLPKTVAFTRNRPQVQASIMQFMTGGMTALHDAVVAGLEHLQEASHQKRVLVVLSDGDDNASQHSDDDMLERARRSDALIYVVSTAELGSNVGNPRLLKKLAESSGGVAYRPENEREVVEAFTEIAQNIRRGYSIGYVPSNTARDGRLRRVRVLVNAPGYRNLSASARDGYLAPRDSDAH
jgi:Ca-activated chloride channel family protein